MALDEQVLVALDEGGKLLGIFRDWGVAKRSVEFSYHKCAPGCWLNDHPVGEETYVAHNGDKTVVKYEWMYHNTTHL